VLPGHSSSPPASHRRVVVADLITTSGPSGRPGTMQPEPLTRCPHATPWARREGALTAGQDLAASLPSSPGGSTHTPPAVSQSTRNWTVRTPDSTGSKPSS